MLHDIPPLPLGSGPWARFEPRKHPKDPEENIKQDPEGAPGTRVGAQARIPPSFQATDRVRDCGERGI